MSECDTPTSRITRITPSPTFDRAENLARLKDATAKLSRGVTPPPPFPNPIPEKKSEIVESPASFHRQIKIESQTHVPLGQNDPDLAEALELSSASVKEKKEFFEEAQKAGVNKSYARKEPIAIPERLGPDVNECEAENKNKEKDDKDCDKEKADVLEQEMPAFDIQAIKNVFELGEQSSSFRDEIKDQKELVSSLSETTADTSKQESPQETKGGSRQSTPLPVQKNEEGTVPAQPSALSETESITEHFSHLDEFGNKVTGTRTAVTVHSESVSTQPKVPFSYADAVKRKAAAAKRTETYDEDATEKLLRNFHKTWTESETVFKSLGYTVSEETTSQAVKSNQCAFYLLETGSSSEVGVVHSVPEESLSDGCSHSGQKEIP
uniref:Xin actin binding repeat containing 2b n=1 Tax=Amphilophus citrinellus TaxID=61819 RepID=A0A3Q0T355_AMPCI